MFFIGVIGGIIVMVIIGGIFGVKVENVRKEKNVLIFEVVELESKVSL